MFGSTTNRKIRRTGGVHSTVTTAAATRVTRISPRGRCTHSGEYQPQNLDPCATKPCSR